MSKVSPTWDALRPCSLKTILVSCMIMIMKMKNFLLPVLKHLVIVESVRQNLQDGHL